MAIREHDGRAALRGQEPGDGVIPRPGPSGPVRLVAINCGGGAEGDWIADDYFSGGGTQTDTITVDQNGQIDPAPDAVYQTKRYQDGAGPYNPFTYTYPTGRAAGTPVKVRLHFITAASISGSEQMDVTINGVLVLDDFNVFNETGFPSQQALVREFDTTADGSGNVVILFDGRTAAGDNGIRGIEVYTLG